MRAPYVLLTLAACVLVACSRSEEAGDAAVPADEGAAATAETEGEVEVAAVYVGHDYTCSDGATFNARLDKGNTLVTLEGKTLTLAPVPGAFDAQYEGEGVMFTARGDEATLIRSGGVMVTCKVN